MVPAIGWSPNVEELQAPEVLKIVENICRTSQRTSTDEIILHDCLIESDTEDEDGANSLQ
jgi:hypothetical protein